MYLRYKNDLFHQHNASDNMIDVIDEIDTEVE